MKDYYKILEIEFGANILKVKKAYRRLALKYHPDVNKASDADQKFLEVTEAYEVLKDPVKKNHYDNIYETFFRNKAHETNFEVENEKTYKQQKEWTDYGREKAREYSSIPFEEFARRLLKEISIGANYIPNAIAILFVGGGAIGILAVLPEVFVDDGGFGVFLLIMLTGLSYLAYRLFLVAQADYREERKQKIIKNK